VIKQLWGKKEVRKWVWIVVTAFVALQIYFVQEMLVALVLFTVVFSMIAGIALFLYVVDRAGQWSLGWVGHHTRPAFQAIRRGWQSVETISRKQLRRLRSEPVR
jgi:hypothetical protein